MKPLPICFFGHRRRKLAVLAVQRLKQYLRFTGYEPRFIFGCCGTDREYIDAVVREAGDWLYRVLPMRQPDPAVNNQLNCAMNDAIREAFRMSDVAFRMEDDWILERPLDLGPWCDLLHDDDRTCFIRLGQIDIDPECVKPYREDLNLDWLDYPPWAAYPINHQCGCIHRRLHDLVGWYREDFTIDEGEFSFGRRFRIATRNFRDGPKVLWPHGQPIGLGDAPGRFFTHAGGSTLGHACFDRGVPERYWAYQEDGWTPPPQAYRPTP